MTSSVQPCWQMRKERERSPQSSTALCDGLGLTNGSGSHLGTATATATICANAPQQKAGGRRIEHGKRKRMP